MEDVKKSVAAAADGLLAVQRIQQRYDEVGWRMSTPELRKVRHISVHLSKVVGRLSGLVERWEHEAFDEGRGEDGVDISGKASEINSVVGDLIYHAAQLASMTQSDLSTCLFAKISSNAKRFAPSSVFVELLELSKARIDPA